MSLCLNGAEMVMINPESTIVGCRDQNQEAGVDEMCPVDFSLCGVEAYNHFKSNSADWDVTPPVTLLGRAYCPYGRTGQGEQAVATKHVALPTDQPTMTPLSHTYDIDGSDEICAESRPQEDEPSPPSRRDSRGRRLVTEEDNMNSEEYGALCCDMPPPPDCQGLGTRITWSWDNRIVVCKDLTENTCEKDFDDICPEDYSLCSVEEFNERNNEWSGEEAPVKMIGRAYCRDYQDGAFVPDIGAGHIKVSAGQALGEDLIHDYYHVDSHLNQCASLFGCNDKEFAALCCNVPGGRDVSGGRRIEPAY